MLNQAERAALKAEILQGPLSGPMTGNLAALASEGKHALIADALNALAPATQPWETMTRAEFTSVFAPVLYRIGSLTDPALIRKWDWCNNMLSQMPSVVMASPTMKKVLSDFLADGLAENLVPLPNGQAGFVPGVDVIAMLKQRTVQVSRAQVALGRVVVVDHVDVGIALKEGV